MKEDDIELIRTRYTILSGYPEGKRQLGRPRRKYEDWSRSKEQANTRATKNHEKQNPNNLIQRSIFGGGRTFASLMDFSQSSLFFNRLTVPRPHIRFLNCWLFPGWDRQPHAQPPTWRARSPYLYPLETGWPSYTPSHRVPILVAFYDMHGLQWDYSFPRSPHEEKCLDKIQLIISWV
jgi:hypothetical protein